MEVIIDLTNYDPVDGRPMPLISILTPTRGRPQSVTRLIRSALETSQLDHGAVEFVFYTDADDHASRAVIDDLIAGGAYITTITGDRIVLSQMWNECAKVARGDIMMHCGDDIIFRTLGWDVIIAAEFNKWPDKIVLVHGRDGYQDERLATHGFRHRRWMEAVGEFVPPYFVSDYNDTWVTEVADALGRRVYLPEVLTEHMHPVIGKASMDQTHYDRLERHAQQDPGALYASLAVERLRDVERLRAVIDRYARRTQG